MKPTRSLPPSLPRKELHAITSSLRMDICGLHGDQGVQALVVLRAVDVHAQRLAVAREGVAVGAGVDAVHQQTAAGSPTSRRRQAISGIALGGQRLDHALLGLRRHQRHVAIEDRRAHRIGGGPDGHLTLRDRTPRAIRVAGDSQGRDGSRRALLDSAPRLGVRAPGTRGCLLRRQLGRLVSGRDAAWINRAEAHAVAPGIHADGGAAVGEGSFNGPRGGVRCGVALEEQGRGKFGREDGAIQGIVHCDGGGFSRRLFPLGDSTPAQNREHKCSRYSKTTRHAHKR